MHFIHHSPRQSSSGATLTVFLIFIILQYICALLQIFDFFFIIVGKKEQTHLLFYKFEYWKTVKALHPYYEQYYTQGNNDPQKIRNTFRDCLTRARRSKAVVVGQV
jgi:hypothetical protein